MLKCQSMKNWVRSKPLVNIILFLLYMESYCCFKIDRESRDISDSLDTNNNCNSISQAFVYKGRCRCSTVASIVWMNTGPIACVKDSDIEGNCNYHFVINTARITIDATTISNCDSGSISQAQYWNMKKNMSAYWHNENDVKNYIELKENGSKLVFDNSQDLFNGLLLRIKISCGEEPDQCLLLKINGTRDYPITRFVSTTSAPSTYVSTTTSTTITAANATKEETAIGSTNDSDNKLKQNPSDDDKNVIVIIATVASVATLIIIILSICLWRRVCQKQKDCQCNTDDSTEQQGNTTQSIYTETQKSDAYAKVKDEYTTITFNSSPKSEGPKPQYLELGLEYQDIKPVYSELSADHQTHVDEPFYREVDEPDGRGLPQPSDMIYHTVEEETPTYEENNYYSAVETLPDELPTAVYAKVKK